MGFGKEFQRVGAVMEKALLPSDLCLIWNVGRGAGCWHQQSGVCGQECVDGGAQSDRVGPFYGGCCRSGEGS